VTEAEILQQETTAGLLTSGRLGAGAALDVVEPDGTVADERDPQRDPVGIRWDRELDLYDMPPVAGDPHVRFGRWIHASRLALCLHEQVRAIADARRVRTQSGA
jgi:hypothetical protein